MTMNQYTRSRIYVPSSTEQVKKSTVRSQSRETRHRSSNERKQNSRPRTGESVSCARNRSSSICLHTRTKIILLREFSCSNRHALPSPIAVKRKLSCPKSKCQRSRCHSSTDKHSRCSPRPSCKRSGCCKHKHCCPRNRPIRVSPVTKTVFGEEKFLDLSVSKSMTLPLQDTSVATVISYAVINTGDAPLVASLEISPNGDHFMHDTAETVPPGGMFVLVPNRFLRYTRIKLVPSLLGRETKASIYYQFQTIGYERKDR